MTRSIDVKLKNGKSSPFQRPGSGTLGPGDEDFCEKMVVVELSYKEESWRRANREVPVAQVVRAPARNVGDLGSTPGGAFIFASAPSLSINGDPDRVMDTADSGRYDRNARPISHFT